MASQKFTKTLLLSLEKPEQGKRLTIYDVDIPKLTIRVTHAGTKTFYVVKRVGTQMAWVKLGAFPDMTVEQARKEAAKILGEFASGANPAETRRTFRAEPTFAEFFSVYGNRHGEKKRSWKDDKQRYRDYLQQPLGNRKLSEITRSMISLVLSDAENAGKSTATIRNIRALASGILAKAVEWGALSANPASGIKVSGAKVTRDRYLKPDELKRFFAALAEETVDGARDYILLALLTGARRSNLCAMRWQEIDFAEGVWRIPRTKNDDPQNVTLSPEAVSVLQERRATVSSEYVFPSAGKTGHYVEPRKAVERIMLRAGIPFGRKEPNGVTLHDLRRTLGSWQAKTGASLPIIGKSLNHKSHAATLIYARLDLDHVRQSVNVATSAMMEAGGLKKKANVVRLKRKN